MADVVSPEIRSRMMSGIRGKNTKPEIHLRSLLHRRGFRFRLHAKDLPGRPDIVLPRYRSAIFVNGCFWHGHDCRYFKWPRTRERFWREKIEANRERDRKKAAALRLLSWRVCVVWECALKSQDGFPASFDTLVEWLQDMESSSFELRGGT
jgi:DNA mismatch endonuclease (patch repair protein)